jgi:uncharacterized protein (TIGR01244 family)
MNSQLLEPGVAIADALEVEDLNEVARQGFKAVICNRRPGEAEDYPDDSALRERAEALGLVWRGIPVSPGEYGTADIAAFGQALDELPTPILAFCRTGRRAVHLWAQARGREQDCYIPALLAAAQRAGHDPQPILEMLDA